MRWRSYRTRGKNLLKSISEDEAEQESLLGSSSYSIIKARLNGQAGSVPSSDEDSKEDPDNSRSPSTARADSDLDLDLPSPKKRRRVDKISFLYIGSSP